MSPSVSSIFGTMHLALGRPRDTSKIDLILIAAELDRH